MNLTDKLTADLADLGYVTRQQGDFTEHEPLPETFLTYLLITADEAGYYSNVGRKSTYLVQIALYSRDKVIVDNAENTLKSILKPKGYLFSTGRDLPKDKNTQHYGYAADYRLYIGG